MQRGAGMRKMLFWFFRFPTLWATQLYHLVRPVTHPLCVCVCHFLVQEWTHTRTHTHIHLNRCGAAGAVGTGCWGGGGEEV